MQTNATTTLSLFPLTGSLLLPGTYLPLNVFEHRYRNMVADALEGEVRIGMIQPRIPADDNLGPAGGSDAPELYTVGGAGVIRKWTREEDGRYQIVLEGTSRFELIEELPLHRGYRRATVRLVEDLSAEPAPSRAAALLPAAIEYCRQRDIEADPDVLAALPQWRLANALSVALPFSPAERQLLLEADGPAARGELLLQLIAMDGNQGGAPSGYEPQAPN